MPPRKKNAHCSYCGSPFADDLPWPRSCIGCGEISYVNPLPVAVTVVPVDGGVLCVRRDIEPGRGQLALPGGFIDLGETWQEACAREVREETGLALDPAGITLFQALSVRNGFLLLFGLAPALRGADLGPFVPTSETSERLVLSAPAELAFPLHTQVLREFFDRRGGHDPI